MGQLDELDVVLRDISPSREEIVRTVREFIILTMFTEVYNRIAQGTDRVTLCKLLRDFMTRGTMKASLFIILLF